MIKLTSHEGRKLRPEETKGEVVPGGDNAGTDPGGTGQRWGGASSRLSTSRTTASLTPKMTRPLINSEVSQSATSLNPCLTSQARLAAWGDQIAIRRRSGGCSVFRFPHAGPKQMRDSARERWPDILRDELRISRAVPSHPRHEVYR
jgi:hypothetical protein